MVKLKDRPGTTTYEEYRTIVPERQKADLIDGVIYIMPAENTEANDLFVWLIRIFADYCEYHDLGKVFGSRVTFRLSDTNAPEPDIGVVLTKHRSRIVRRHVLGAADLAVEIVSPESVSRDYYKKRELYERFKFPEYWIVDEQIKKFTLLRLEGTAYKEIKPRKGILTSKVLPGFWFRPEWVWTKPRPKKVAVLAEILAGVPK